MQVAPSSASNQGLQVIRESQAVREEIPQSANLRRTRSFDPQAGRQNAAKGYNPDRGHPAGGRV